MKCFIRTLMVLLAAQAGLPTLFAQWGDEWNVGWYNRCHLKFSESAFSTTTKPWVSHNLIAICNANICNEYGELLSKTNANQVLDSNKPKVMVM